MRRFQEKEKKQWKNTRLWFKNINPFFSLWHKMSFYQKGYNSLIPKSHFSMKNLKSTTGYGKIIFIKNEIFLKIISLNIKR